MKNPPSFSTYAPASELLPRHLAEALGAATFLADTADSIRRMVAMRDPAIAPALVSSIEHLRALVNHANAAIRAAVMELCSVREVAFEYDRFITPTAHQAAIEYKRAVMNAIWSGEETLELWHLCHLDNTVRMDADIFRGGGCEIVFNSAADSLERAKLPDARPIIAEANLEAARAGRMAATTAQAEKPQGGRPPDAYAELRQFARACLKGQERAVIEALCDSNGELPIADLAVKDGLGWEDPFQGFKDVQRRLSSKLKKLRWELKRQDGAAKLKSFQGAKEV